MATKDKLLTKSFPNHSPLVNENKYNNLNLNGTNSSSNTVTVKPAKNVVINDKVQQNKLTTSNANSPFSTSWNSDQRESLKSIQEGQPKIFQHRKKKNGDKDPSTLQLHITSYENSVKASAPDFPNGSPEDRMEKTTSRLKRKLRNSESEKQLFKFPRQQETVSSSKTEPETMPFKQSQRLFVPNSAKSYIRIINPNPTPSTVTTKTKDGENGPVDEENEALPSSSSSPPSPPSPPPPPLPSLPRLPALYAKRRYIAPEIPKLMTSEEMENFQYDDPELRQWQEKYLKDQKPPPPETAEEELIRLRKENQNLRQENANLKADNTVLKCNLNKIKGAQASQKYRDNKKKSETTPAAEPKPFETYHPDSQSKIISNIWKDIESTYGKENAVNIINIIHKKQVGNKSLTPLQTLQILKSSGITITALRKIRSILNASDVYNPFASEAAVNAERAKIHEKAKMVKKTVLMDGKNGEKVETDVYSIPSVVNELKDRLQTIVKNDNYKPFYHNGVEEVPCVISGDKGEELTTVIMGVGSTKKPRNSPNNGSLLGYYKGNDSQANLYAAFGDSGGLAQQIDNINEVEIEIDGVLRKFKIRWFLLGDFKFLNAVAGLNTNSGLFPCWGCLQKSETTYGELDLNLKAPSRTMDINKNFSQIREPLFKNIPFDHYIPPILHITLGPGAQLFEQLCEKARELDTVELEGQNISQMLPSANVQKSWLAIQENVENLKVEIEQLNYAKSLYAVPVGEERYVCDSAKCFALHAGNEINNVFNNDQLCSDCFGYFHPCCLYKEGCPRCSQKFPTSKQCQAVVDKQLKEVEKKLKHTVKLLKEEEEKANGMISKYKLGKFEAEVEKIFEKFGGSRKAFFQQFTGKQLNKMGSNIHGIYFALSSELKADPKIQKIICAIIQFFNIKKLLTTEVLSDSEIEDIEEIITDFATYMKENFPNVRVKQKGHTLFKHLPQFIKKFHIAAYFIDECIESFHVVINKYKRRIGNRHGDKRAQLLFKYNKEDTWLFDTFCNYNP